MRNVTKVPPKNMDDVTGMNKSEQGPVGPWKTYIFGGLWKGGGVFFIKERV